MPTDLLQLLAVYTPADDREAVHKQQLMQFLQTSDNPYDRSNLTAHVVADGWVVNSARSHVLLVARSNPTTWLVPGGHCDGNPDTAATAVRELSEETGITNLKPLGSGLFDIQTHLVPFAHKKHGPEPEHVHYNVCFAFEADDQAPLILNDENAQVAWVKLADIPQLRCYESVMRRFEKMQHGLLR